MNKRLLLLAPAAAAVVACVPPKTRSVTFTACTAAVTEFFEAVDMKLPCWPTPPQRVDIFVEIGGDPYGANVRCGAAYGGTPSNDLPAHEGWQRCRTIDPQKFID